MAEDCWVVIAATSRYWHNYRHEANAFVVYEAAKAMGVPDEQIVFLDATDAIHSPRNAARGQVHVDSSVRSSSLLPSAGSGVDYRGEEVTVDLFLALLAGEVPEESPRPQLRSTTRSNVLIYLSGHGGDEFFKFHDAQELDALVLAQAVRRMQMAGRFGQLLLVLDTCQAATMGAHLLSVPNVTVLASSLRGENSYGLHMNADLGVSTVDRFTFTLGQFFRRRGSSKRATLQDLVAELRPSFLYSTPWLAQSPGAPPPEQLRWAEFFAPGRVAARPGPKPDSIIPDVPNEPEQELRFVPWSLVATAISSPSAGPSPLPSWPTAGVTHPLHLRSLPLWLLLLLALLPLWVIGLTRVMRLRSRRAVVL